MKRGILIDLGDTVFSNIDLSMEVGGEYLYEMIRGPSFTVVWHKESLIRTFNI